MGMATNVDGSLVCTDHDPLPWVLATFPHWWPWQDPDYNDDIAAAFDIIYRIHREIHHG